MLKADHEGMYGTIKEEEIDPVAIREYMERCRQTSPLLWAVVDARSEAAPQEGELRLLKGGGRSGFKYVFRVADKVVEEQPSKRRRTRKGPPALSTIYPFKIYPGLAADSCWPTNLSFSTAESAAIYVRLAVRAGKVNPFPLTEADWAAALERARTHAPLCPRSAASSSQ